MLPESVPRWLSFCRTRGPSARRRSTHRNGWELLESRQLLAADPVLSELVALNRSTLQDEDGHFSDWLEIENRGDQPAALGGYFLTNSSADLTAWQLPARSLAPGQSLVIFASGKDRRGETLHTNFTLADQEGFLALVHSDGSTIVSQFDTYPALAPDQAYGTYSASGDFRLVSGDEVRVWIPTDNRYADRWTGRNEPFDDSTASGWLHGSGPVGFDRNATAPDLPIQMDVGDAMHGRTGSAFLRYSFLLDRPEALQTVSLHLDFDDGYILYLNGQELLRRNAPTLPNHASTAPTDLGRVESQWDLTRFREYFRPGQNVLAIHGLNSSPDEGEFLIDVQLTARGLMPEATGVLDVPTPGTTNGHVEPVITEFMAANRQTLDDEDGESSDWIELHNPGLVDVSLQDWYLTDDAQDLTGWQFPRTNLKAGEYLLVFASGKDRDQAGGPLHTDFRLAAEGDYLALVRPDGTVRWEYDRNGQPFGPQYEDISFGVRGSSSSEPNDPVRRASSLLGF